MKVRIVAGVIFAAVFIASILLGEWTTLAFATFLTVVAAWEMVDAIRATGFHAQRWPAVTFALLYTTVAKAVGPQHIFSFMVIMVMAALTTRVLDRDATPQDMLATVLPFLYPLNFFAFLGIVLMLPHEIWLTLFICAVGLACFDDMGAYFIGSFFGRHKLAPHLSPKKTIEGSVGGIVLGTLSGALFYSVQWIWGAALPLSFFLISGLFCSAMGQVGDLLASAIKRMCGIKDFGKIVPGHGGVLDRLDSIVFALPTIYIVYSLFVRLGLL